MPPRPKVAAPSAITLVPGGKEVPTPGPSVIVAALNKAGTFTFIVRVVDDAGLVGAASVDVTVRPG